MEQPDTRYHELAVPGVRALHPYLPGKPVAELEREYGIRDAIKLASNENPLGPSPVAMAAAQRELETLVRYPEGSAWRLTAALAERHAVTQDAVTPGNGSNDVLDMIARVFLGPGTEAVFSEHAFAVYPIVVQATGATARVAPALADNRGHDLDAMAACVGPATRVVFIANPNNPTGTWLAAQDLHRFLAELPEYVIAVVDEAYFEYVQEPDYPDTTTWLAEFPNLVVTRTFSKAWGLAGLRVGYAVSAPGIAALLNRVRHPFNVNSLAQAAAAAALADRDHLAAVIRLNREGLRQLEVGLSRLGLSWIPSVGNFVTLDTGRAAGEVYEQLLRQGVIVRPVANYGLPRHLRVTTGLPEENARFLSAIGRVLG